MSRRTSKRSQSVSALRILDKEKKALIGEINEILDDDPPDLRKLRKVAILKGLVNNGIRARAWPALLEVDPFRVDVPAMDELDGHRDYSQIEVDIERSMWKFTEGMKANISFGAFATWVVALCSRRTYRDSLPVPAVLCQSLLKASAVTRLLMTFARRAKRNELRRVLHGIAKKYPDVHYYQGLHDICSVLILVANVRTAFAIAEKLALYNLSDATQESLEAVLVLLNLVFPLVQLEDPEVFAFLDRSQVQPSVAIAWLITWFSHSLDSLDKVARLFDFFLATHPLMPVYFVATSIVFLKPGLLSCECEFSAVHHFLHNLPQDLPVEDLIWRCLCLFSKFPPSTLQQHAGIFLPKSSPMASDPSLWDCGLGPRLPRPRRPPGADPNLFTLQLLSQVVSLLNSHKGLVLAVSVGAAAVIASLAVIKSNPR